MRRKLSAYQEPVYNEEVSNEDSTDGDLPSPKPVEYDASARRPKSPAPPQPIIYQKTVQKESKYRTQAGSSHSGQESQEIGRHNRYIVKKAERPTPKLSSSSRIIEKRSRKWSISPPSSSPSSPVASHHAWGPLKLVLALWLIWFVVVLAAVFVAELPRWSFSGHKNYIVDYYGAQRSAVVKAASNVVSSLPSTWQEAVEAVTRYFASRFVFK